jgi:hypothetical protein
VVFRRRPQPACPWNAVAHGERPALVPDRAPGLRRQARRRDRLQVPAEGGLLARALALLVPRVPQLLAASGKYALAIVGRGALHLVDQRRQARLRVAVDGQVHRQVALEVLVVRADVDILHRDAHHARILVADEAQLVVRIGERVELAERIRHFEEQHDIGFPHQAAARLVVRQRMGRREIHAAAQVHHGRLQCLRELHEKLHAVLVAHAPVGDDHRVFGSHQPLRRLGERGAVALGRARARELRNLEVLLVDRAFLQVDVRGDEHRLIRRRGRDLVGAHGRFGEVLQRGRAVVPFDEVAHQRARVLDRVVPLRARPARSRIEPVAGEKHDRHAIDPRVVDRHGAVLQAHGAVDHRAHGLARGLGVSMRHRDGGFLVHAREQLRLLVAAVVDERFVDAAEARPGVGRHVLQVERLDDVDHEIGTGTIDDDVAG